MPEDAPQYPKKLYKPGGQIVRVLNAEEHAEYADWSEDHRVRLEPEPSAPRRGRRRQAAQVEEEEDDEA